VKNINDRRSRRFRGIIAAVFVSVFAAQIVFAFAAFAEANLFKIQSVELTNLSDTAEGVISSYDETGIASSVTFHKINDSAEYTIILKNTDSKEHTIESIADDNNSPYITYEYDQHANEVIGSGRSLVFAVTAKYATAIANIDQRMRANSVKFFIRFTDIEEEVSITSGTNTNPNTGDYIYISAVIFTASIAILAIVCVLVSRRHRKASKILAISIVAVASIATITTVKAVAIATDNFVINADFNLKSKLVATYEDGNGNSHEIVVDYNDKLTLGNQTKTGYTFTGWKYENGDPFNSNTNITDDIAIKPSFRKNSYTISFDGNQGVGSMSDLVMTYDEDKQLAVNGFTYTGHSFLGWNTKADGTGESFADAQSVKNLIATDQGNIILYAQWGANSYTISFNSNAPESTIVTGMMPDLIMTYNVPKKLTNNLYKIDGYNFASWNTKADGSGNTIYNGAQVNNLVENGTITLYAIWEEKIFVCKVATKLHEEPCENSGTGGCAASDGGSSSNATITYGTLQDGGSPKAGDAYDCDVNGDDVFDPETERFYYLHTVDGNAVMFYYDNLTQTDMSYSKALSYLPTTATWANPSLINFGGGVVSRLATVSDISLGCGGIDVEQDGALLSCKYLLEGTSYANSTNRRSTYLLERSVDGGQYYRVHKNSRKVTKINSSTVGAPRPVIEVPMGMVQGFRDDSDGTVVDDIISYDIASNAVKNYYASVDAWTTSEHSFLTAMKENYDSNSCKATAMDPQISTDFLAEYRYLTTGNIACDKPKSYDTKTNKAIKVYLSDEDMKNKGDEATYVSVSNGIITNMIPGVTYYWESIANSNIHGFVKAVGVRRLLSLPTARNVRDIGGIEGANGKTIQYGRIIRGEKLGSDDAIALNNLGINKEYDVRSEDNGLHFAEGYERHAMINYDIIDESNYADARNALTSLMNDIVAGNNIYIHCSHGSDRTGTLVYLAEALLGVSDEDRDRDYDMTALSGRPDRTRYYDHMAQNVSGFNSQRKYTYMKTKLPDEAAVREWYFRGSTNRAADEQLIVDFQNAILE